jgi:alkanesulfonate monooxygenase
VAASIGLHWYLPTAGESRSFQRGGTNVHVPAGLQTEAGFRAPSLSYLTQIALGLEEAGFESVLVPTGSYCEDPWVVASALAAQTSTLRFLVALHPRTTTPALTAHQAASFQRISKGRLALNVVTGEPGAEARRHGDTGDKAAQYGRTGEFLSVVRALGAGETVDFAGQHYRVEGASLAGAHRPAQTPPQIWFGGSSDHALPVAGAHADVYLSWLEPLDQLAEKIDRVRAAAAAFGREPRFGVRSWVLARDSDDEAFAAAHAHLDGLDDARLAAVRPLLLARESVGQQRGQALLERADHRDPASLLIAPNLWGGFGLLAGGPALGFVGGHTQIADRFEEFAALGVSEFILSGFPNLEESRWVGEGLVPELHRRGLLRH